MNQNQRLATWNDRAFLDPVNGRRVHADLHREGLQAEVIFGEEVIQMHNIANSRILHDSQLPGHTDFHLAPLQILQYAQKDKTSDQKNQVPNRKPSIAAETLVTVRKLAKLTLAEAAKQINDTVDERGPGKLSASQLSRIETGTAHLTSERLEQLAEFYNVDPASLVAGNIMKAPSRIELERLHNVVVLTHDVIQSLRVSPSPQKIADAITMVYERETQRVLDSPELRPDFDPSKHQSFLEAMFRK